MRTQTGAVLAGLAFGMLVWVVMDLVVLKLSRTGSLPPSHPRFWINLAQHAVMVGLPIALIVRDGERGRTRRQRAAEGVSLRRLQVLRSPPDRGVQAGQVRRRRSG
jgi:hypothetical protein